MSFVKDFHEWSKQFDPQPDKGWNGFIYYGYRFVRPALIGGAIVFGAAVIWMLVKLILFFFGGQTP